MSQDEIDELRSKYSRQSQDEEFLRVTREKLLNSFNGDLKQDLKIITIDLGEIGASIGVFKGKECIKAQPLKIIKINKLFDRPPELDQKDSTKKSEEKIKCEKQKGLRKEHLGRHLESWAKESSKIMKKRPLSKLGDHDLRRLSLHIKWMIRDWVRLNASQIIKAAETEGADLIVFESLRGFTAPGYDKIAEEKKRWLAVFSYGRIRHKVKEKAVERGMRVITVPYRYSSQICSKCGKIQKKKGKWRKNKKKHLFECEFCNHKDNSDDNTVKVLAKVFWGDISLPKSR
ncbi:MAG: transposase [Candidatus Eremiobacteraeota bacterium]|nr:transposase [Candidatus Eremiobacteraeota bacterium]